jgi:hypothetical protein
MFYTTEWPKFNAEFKRTLVIYPIKKAFINSTLSFKTSVINVGESVFIYSDEIHVAYGFTINNGIVLVRNANFFLAHKKEINWNYLINNKVKPEIHLSNSYLTIYTYGEDALLVVRKKLIYPLVLPA